MVVVFIIFLDPEPNSDTIPHIQEKKTTLVLILWLYIWLFYKGDIYELLVLLFAWILWLSFIYIW